MERVTRKGIESLRRPGRYRADTSLYLEISTGADGRILRRWIQRIVIRGRRRDLGLGTWPETSLTEARERAYDNRRTARRGGDPMAAAGDKPTLRRAAQTVADGREYRGRYGQSRATALERYAGGLLDRIIDQIDRSAVLAVLLPIYTTKPATGRRVRGWLREIFAAGQSHGWIDANPAGEVIDAALPAVDRKDHHDAMPYADVPGAVESIRGSRSGQTIRAALEFIILTAVRSGEARGAMWSEIDLEAREWRIPATRMKAGREHRVPLSDASLSVLKTVRGQSDPDGLVFPSGRGVQLRDTTLLASLRRAVSADKTTVHGFRSSFRVWAAERSGESADVAEHALAHSVGSAVERAYQRSTVFDRRRKLMAAWADHVTGSTVAKIVQGRF